MTREFEVTAEELVRTLQRRGIPLPSEVGAFVVLEACEKVIGRSVLLRMGDIYITESGDVECEEHSRADSESAAVSALLGVLAELLVCAAPGVPNMLLDLVEHGPNEASLSLGLLRSDLEACLLPLNRGAQRRVLSRLVREVQKVAPGAPGQAPTAEVGDVDASFDDLLGDTSPPPRAARASSQGAPELPRGVSSSRPAGPQSEAQLRPASIRFEEEVTRHHEITADPRGLRTPVAPSRSSPARRSGPSRSSMGTLARAESGPRAEPQRAPRSSLDARPRSRAPVDLDALEETSQAARGRLGLWVFLGTTLAAVAMLLGYFALGREQSRSALGFLKPRDGGTAPSAVAVPQRVYGDLRVNSRPDRAQVLLLIGPGPALATDIPLGVAQEFLALARGHRPARALLPADAVWDELNGQPRYELAIQARALPEGRGSRGMDVLGPTLLPHNVGTPTGRLGAVRVVTTPRSAEVFQLIGFTPDVHVDNLPLDHAYELLVYAEGRKTARTHLEPSDFVEQDGKRVARVDVQLPAAQ